MSDIFKDRLAEALEIRKMKAADLVEKTGINKARISQYVNGVYTPKSKATYIIAQALNVDEKWLMGFDVPMEKTESTKTTPFPNANEQELLTIYRNVNEDGQEYIMQTARMVEGTERYRKYETVRAASRSVTDKPIEDIKVEKSKIEAALADDSIKTDDDL